MNKETQHKLSKLDSQMAIEAREGDLSRARSVTVGTCFGGTVELMMRGNSGYMWCPLQPVEVIELIHQLAAGVGCHIAIKPRQDFASWRDWKVDSHNDAGPTWPPFVNDMAPHNQVGANLPPPEQQPGMIKSKSRSTENVMATEEPKNRRSSKRTAKAA